MKGGKIDPSTFLGWSKTQRQCWTFHGEDPCLTFCLMCFPYSFRGIAQQLSCCGCRRPEYPWPQPRSQQSQCHSWARSQWCWKGDPQNARSNVAWNSYWRGTELFRQVQHPQHKRGLFKFSSRSGSGSAAHTLEKNGFGSWHAGKNYSGTPKEVQVSLEYQPSTRSQSACRPVKKVDWNITQLAEGHKLRATKSNIHKAYKVSGIWSRAHVCGRQCVSASLCVCLRLRVCMCLCLWV